MKLLNHLIKPKTLKILPWLRYLKFYCMTRSCYICSFNNNGYCAVAEEFMRSDRSIKYLKSPSAWILPDTMPNGTPITSEKPPSLDFIKNLTADNEGNPILISKERD